MTPLEIGLSVFALTWGVGIIFTLALCALDALAGWLHRRSSRSERLR